MLGLGYAGTITPPVIRRNVLENPAWYTAYTPYQPEISQGRLEALLTFQTMVADLTGLPVAGASLLDEATAAAEAMTLLRRAGRSKQRRGSSSTPTPCRRPSTCCAPGPSRWASSWWWPTCAAGLPDGRLLRGAAVSYPGASGAVRDPRPLIEAAHERGALVAVAADLLALTLLTPPGELGADAAVGSTQRFGVPLGFGGPHAGYLSVPEKLARQLPGRLVGMSRDADGHPALRLALQTREQHIRREKATSNICTAQVLLAVVAACYAVLPRAGRAAPDRAAGAPDGRGAGRRAARRRGRGRARRVLRHRAGRRARAGPTRWSPPRTTPGILLRRVDADTVGIACSEVTTGAHLDGGVGGLRGGAATSPSWTRPPPTRCPPSCAADSDYLTHPVFARAPLGDRR